MPGIYDLLQVPAIAASSELAQTWRLPDAALDYLVDWEPCTFLPPPRYALFPDWQQARPRALHGLPTVGDYPIRLAEAEQPDGSSTYVGMLARDLLTAMTIMAPMGTGKTHLAKIMLSELLRIGAGVAVTDFKADLVADMLQGMIPRAKEAETLVVDLADTAWPIAINPLVQPRADRGTTADSLLTLIGRLDETFATGVGMQEFARNAALALLEAEPEPDLLKLHRFMISEPYRRRLVEGGVRDAMVREFWLHDFPQRGEAQRSSVDALVRRFGLFLMQPIIRHIVCRPRTTLDFRTAMDHGQIVLASLPVEIVGNGIGGFAATMLQELLNSAAFSRAADNVPVEERRFFLNLIDEFQQAVNSGDPAAVATQIAKLRAMGVGSVYLYQSSAQIPADLRAQIESNVANTVCLGALGGDIPTLLQRWGTSLTAADFAGMRRREDMYLQIQVNERKSPPFRARSLALWPALKQPDLGKAPRQDWRDVRAPVEAAWHSWMDDRITGLQRYEQEATTARDEARALRSQAALVRRGMLADAERERDAWERSRTDWPSDARELLARADVADGRARDLEQTPLQLLTQAPDPLWTMYRQRAAEHRLAQRTFLRQHPAAVPDSRQRIVWLSRLLLAEPMVEVAAYVERTVKNLAAAGSRGTATAAPRRVVVAPGQPLPPGDGALRLKGLPPWSADHRAAVDVVEAVAPPFFLPPEQLQELPVIYEVERV